MNDKPRRQTRVGPGDAVLLSGKPTPLPQARVSMPQVPPVSPRKRVLVDVYCEIEGLAVELDPHELSAAGLFVETPQPARVDSEVEMFLRIGEVRIATLGHVVTSVSVDQATHHGKRPGYALLFTNLSESERKRLAQAIHGLPLQAEPAQAPAARASRTSVAPASKRRSLSPPRASRVRGASLTPAAANTQASAPAPRASAKPAAVPVRIDPAELTLIARLTKECAELADKPAWTILGVSQGADYGEIRTAFFAASKRYHPHLFARYAHPDIKRLVTDLFIAHKRAYTTLLKTSKTSPRASRP